MATLGDRVLLILGFVLAASATGAQVPLPSEVPVGSFAEAPSPYPIPTELAASALTGHVAVPVTHFDPTQRERLRLPVVKLPAIEEPQGAPVVLLAGGPGESTLASYLPGLAASGARGVREHHDIVLIELRGLAYAEPALIFREAAEARLDWLAQPLPYDDAAMKLQLDAFSAAYRRYTEAGLDLNHFTFAEMAGDVVVAMRALGYETFSVYGNSAGTILVQHIMRAHPDRLEAVVMGSSIPPTVNPRAGNPAVAERAFKRLFNAVANDPVAADAFPHLEADFFELVDRLNDRPWTGKIADPVSGRPVSLALTGDRLIELVYTMLLLDSNGAALVPIFVDSLYDNDFSLLGNFGALLLPPPDFSWGVQLSAMLAEYSPVSHESIPSAGIYPDIHRVMSCWRFGPVPMEAAREVWPVNPPESEWTGLVTVNVPTLLLSGELDPATPPEYAETIAESLPDATRIVFSGVGHGPLDAGPCALDLARSFLDNPAAPLDTNCARAMRARFFVEPLARRLLLPVPPMGRLILLAVCVVLLAGAVVVYATESFLRRAGSRAIQRPFSLSHGFIFAAAVLNLVFVAVMVYALASAETPMHVLYKYPDYLRYAQILPLMSFVPTVAAMGSILAMRRKSSAGVVMFLYDVTIAFVNLLFLLQLNWWNLLVPRL